MSVWNTLTWRKEPVQPFDPPRLRLSVCGPTVYDESSRWYREVPA